MRRPIVTAVAALATLAATAAVGDGRDARAQRDLDRALAGRTPGRPESCISQSRVNGPEIIDGHTILYRQSGRRIWRNDLPEHCPFLHDFDDVLIVETTGSELCRNDRFRVINRPSSIPSGYCRLGNFVPYDKPKG